MKKLLFLFAILAATFTVKAQTNVAKLATTTSYNISLDTVNNAGAKSTNAQTLQNWYYGASVQAHVIVTKISGTVGGSIGLYGSMDGTNWTLCGSATTPTDATANYYLTTTVRYAKYKIMYTGTGTMSASFKTYFLY